MILFIVHICSLSLIALPLIYKSIATIYAGSFETIEILDALALLIYFLYMSWLVRKKNDEMPGKFLPMILATILIIGDLLFFIFAQGWRGY